MLSSGSSRDKFSCVSACDIQPAEYDADLLRIISELKRISVLIPFFSEATPQKCIDTMR